MDFPGLDTSVHIHIVLGFTIPMIDDEWVEGKPQNCEHLGVVAQSNKQNKLDSANN